MHHFIIGLLEVCMLAKRTYKNQVTIPKEVMDQVGEVDYFDVFLKDGQIVLRPVEILGREERLGRIRQKIKALGLTENDIASAIQWARSQAPKS
jgi:hypothetical protein